MPTVVLGLLLCLVAGSVQAARFGHEQLDLGTLVVAALLVSGVLLVAGATSAPRDAIVGDPPRRRPAGSATSRSKAARTRSPVA